MQEAEFKRCCKMRVHQAPFAVGRALGAAEVEA